MPADEQRDLSLMKLIVLLRLAMISGTFFAKAVGITSVDIR